MIRSLNFILLFAGVLALVAVYTVKFQVEDIAGVKLSMERQIAEQEIELRALRADWAVLNQPGQIEPIIRRHQDTLKLAVVGADQFKTFDDLPMRPVTMNADGLTAFIKAIEDGYDPIAALIEAN